MNKHIKGKNASCIQFSHLWNITWSNSAVIKFQLIVSTYLTVFQPSSFRNLKIFPPPLVAWFWLFPRLLLLNRRQTRKMSWKLCEKCESSDQPNVQQTKSLLSPRCDEWTKNWLILKKIFSKGKQKIYLILMWKLFPSWCLSNCILN